MNGQQYLGWPLSDATEDLKKKGIGYRVQRITEPRGSVAGDDERIIAVDDKNEEILLMTSFFHTLV